MPPPRVRVPRWTSPIDALRPMLAAQDPGQHERVLARTGWLFERKFDGIRALIAVEPATPTAHVRILSRNGTDKTAQFPDIVRAVAPLVSSKGAPLVLDGEIVAIDDRGEPVSFTHLGRRIHLTDAGAIAARTQSTPTAFVAFDILREGGDDVRGLSLVERKARLDRVCGPHVGPRLRVSDIAGGDDGVRLYATAGAQGWEGLIAKEAASPYEAGRRVATWVKLKLPLEGVFVVGGWTEPRGSRQHFGGLLVGTRDAGDANGALQYRGSVGSGFNDVELQRVHALLTARATRRCPFVPTPKTPETPHWVHADMQVRVRFTEFSKDGMLRHPVYLGEVGIASGEDVAADDGPSRHAGPHARRRGSRVSGSASIETPLTPGTNLAPPRTTSARASSRRRTSASPRDESTRETRRTREEPLARTAVESRALALVQQQLLELEDARRDGRIVLPDGSALDVTNLAKLLWPTLGITKGELLRYYVRVAPFILPCLADRPMVMKRYPHGVTGSAFYQHRAPDAPPSGVRVAIVETDEERVPRIIGGSLQALLYTTQLGSLSKDPWFSTVDTPQEPREVAIDLDPMPGVSFAEVRDVARGVRDVVQALELPACVKTSGASGIHVYLPLAPGTSYETAQAFSRIISSTVVMRRPTLATLERKVAARGRTVYVDDLQNIEGKTLACAYAVRATDVASVSTPLRWDELDDPGLHPSAFTLRSLPSRLESTGDLWAPMHAGPRVNVAEAVERMRRLVGR